MTRVRGRSLALLAACALALGGCGYFGYGAGEATPRDASTDATLDAGVDAGLDAGLDAGTDAGLDAGPDAGTDPGADAGTDGGQPDGGPGVPCEGTTALVCSDFDDTSGFTAFQSNGLVQIVSGVLDTQTVAPGGYASLVATFAPVTSGTLYFRGHIRIVGSFAITDVNTLMIGNRLETDFGLDFDLVDGGELRVNESTGPGVDSVAVLPRDTWVCLQGTIVVGETNGSVTVLANGSPLVSTTNADTLPPNGIQHVSLGIDWTAGNQGNARVQWDDFALGENPVPCD